MMKRLLFALAALNLGLFSTLNAQLTVTQTANATTLAQRLVGTGVTITNATFTGATAQGATFINGGATNIGMYDGVILSTGSASMVNGQSWQFAQTAHGRPADADLNAISTGTPSANRDAAVLEFDFTVLGNQLSFNYVFGSEEYTEYTCDPAFNDIFAFFLTGPNPNGPAYNKTNVALVPNTNLPVAIGTINSGVPSPTVISPNCQSLANSSMFVANRANNGTSITLDGFTNVLTARADVIPCQVYHIKLAIQDVGDALYDSDVFLQANSFVSQPTVTTSTYDFSLTNAYEGCNNGLFTITAPNFVGSSTPITYTISGTATNGTDYVTLPGTVNLNPGTSTATIYVDPIIDGTSEGPETVTITIFDGCSGTTSVATITIDDRPADTAYSSAPVVCSTPGSVQLTATGGGTYAWSPPTGLSSTTSATPTATISSPTTYTVTATLGNCTSTNSVSIGVSNLTLSGVDSTNLTICPGGVATIGADADNGVSPITYQWSPPNQVSNPTAPIVSVTPTATTTYYVTATDGAGCTVTADVTVNVDTIAQIRFGNDVYVCPSNSPYTLSVPGGPYTSYLWSNGATTPTIQLTSTDSVSVRVTNSTCSFVSDTIAVIFYPAVNPVLADASICSGSSVTLTAQPGLTNVIWNTSATGPTLVVTTPGTYSYTATDANGCLVTSNTATVTAGAAPTISITADEDTLCANETTVLRGVGLAGTTYSWTGGSTADTLVVTGPGTYSLTASSGGCPTTVTFEVYGFTNPNVLVGADTTVCNGDTVVFRLLNGPFQSYIWSNGVNGVDSIVTNVPGTYTISVFDGNCTWTSNSVTLANFVTPVPTLSDTGACTGTPLVLNAEAGLVGVVWSDATAGSTITITTAGTYYYTAQDVNGCAVASDTVDVNFLPAPTVNATADEDTICFGSSTVLRANATGGSLSYTWAPTASSADTLVVTQAGTYYVTVSNGFCPVTDSVVVVQYPYTPVLTNNDTTVCPGSDVVVSVSGTYTSYLWSNGVTTASFTTDTAGSYTVTVTSGTCTYVSDVFVLSNFPVDSPSLADAGACIGQSVTLNAQPGFTNIVWSTSAVTNSITVSTAGNYYYTATNPNGCTVTSQISTVTFDPAPTVNPTASVTTLCPGQTSVLSANATGTNLSYVWSTSVTDTLATVTVNAAGTYTVTVSNGFCTASGTVNIAAFPTTPPTIISSGGNTVCPGTSVTLSVSGTYTSYTWSNGPTTPTVTVSTPGTYTVVVGDANCTVTSSAFVLSNYTLATPTASTTTPSVCNGTPVTLNGEAGYTNYLWQPGSLPGQNVTVNNAGTYSYTATDANGCTVTSNSVTITNSGAPASDITSSKLVLCGSTDRIVLRTPGVTGVTYTWTPGGSTADSLVVTSTGTYTLTANVGTCQSSSSVTITTGAGPVFTLLNGNDSTSCCTAIELNPGLGTAGYGYLWSNTTNSETSTGSTLTVTTTDNDTMYYTVLVTDSNSGCASSQSVALRIKCIDPVATANPTEIVLGDSSELSVVTAYSDVTFSYLWTPDSALSSTTLANVNASPTDTTTYTVLVTDPIDGCTATAQVIVYVKGGEPFKVPTAFTPNGDGPNDFFLPRLQSGQEVTEMRIYNRWGALVHNSIEGWDGTFNGAEQPTGTFIYYITVRVPDAMNVGQMKEKKVTGSFILLR